MPSAQETLEQNCQFVRSGTSELGFVVSIKRWQVEEANVYWAERVA